MMDLEKLEAALLIKINPNYQDVGYEQEEIDHEFRNLLQINGAVEDFVLGNLDEDTFLDVIEFYGQNPDKYIKVASENLRAILNT